MKSFTVVLQALALMLISALTLFGQAQKEAFDAHELEMILGTIDFQKGDLNFQIEEIPGVDNINVTNHPLPQNETALGVNPANPDNLVISMNDFRAGLSGQSVGYSLDAGLSWQVSPLMAPQVDVYYMDPSVGFDPEGNVYVAFLAVKQGVQFSGTGIAVVRSQDGGQTWSEVTYVANDLDNSSVTHTRPFVAVGANDEVFVSWVMTEGENAFPIIARSADGGQSFGAMTVVSQQSGLARNAVSAVTADGTVYVAYFDMSVSKIWVSRSANGGETFETIHSIAVEQIGEPMGFRRILKGSLKVNSYPMIAVDRSNARTRDNVYVVWADRRLGDADVFMSRMDAAGWTEPVRVNNDGTASDQFFPAVSVDAATGALNIAFYDSRNDEENILVDTYVARSFDAGDSFVNQRISTAASNPTVGFSQGSQTFFGDYLAVDSYDNKVYAAFTDSRLGDQEVFLARYSRSGSNDAEGPSLYTLNQNYPNPFNPSTLISFELNEEAVVSLAVYNSIGQKVATVIDAKVLDAKQHQFRFDAAGLASGVYFYRLQAGAFVSTRKMVLVR